MNGNFFKYALVAAAGVLVGIAIMKNKDEIIEVSEKIIDSAKHLKDKAADSAKNLKNCATDSIKGFSAKS